MFFRDFHKSIINTIKSDYYSRIISIDIEGSLKLLEDKNEKLLSVSTARRLDKFIEIKKFIVNNESEKDEVELLTNLGFYLGNIKPLILVGYNIHRFDLLVLLNKLRSLENSFRQGNVKLPKEYWNLRDAFTNSFILDVMDHVKFEIADRSDGILQPITLEKAINHPLFSHLPFKNTKHIVTNMIKNPDDKNEKWEIIHTLWKDNRHLFEEYIEGDVHDTLLIAEDIFKIDTSGVYER